MHSLVFITGRHLKDIYFAIGQCGSGSGSAHLDTLKYQTIIYSRRQRRY